MSAGYLGKCGTKKRHVTQQEAEGQRWALIAKGKWRPGTSNTYHCTACGHYHAGRMGAANRGKSRKIKTREVFHTQ